MTKDQLLEEAAIQLVLSGEEDKLEELFNTIEDDIKIAN